MPCARAVRFSVPNPFHPFPVSGDLRHPFQLEPEIRRFTAVN
jgi:hypothetical protein